jgi:CRP/FNR family transcriptional regulator
MTSLDDADSRGATSGTAVPFAGMAPAVWTRIEALGIRCRFRPKQALFRAGGPADALYFILSGRVRVSREMADHVELLHSESAGGVLAEIPVFGGGAFPATAIATEPTLCIKLPIAAVRRFLREEPEFAAYAVARLAVRAQSLLRRIDELTASTVAMRVAAHVLARASDGPFSLGISQAALADEIGTAREVVVRAIAALVRAGALRRVGRSRFEVANLSVLRAMAADSHAPGAKG